MLESWNDQTTTTTQADWPETQELSNSCLMVDPEFWSVGPRTKKGTPEIRLNELTRESRIRTSFDWGKFWINLQINTKEIEMWFPWELNSLGTQIVLFEFSRDQPEVGFVWRQTNCARTKSSILCWMTGSSLVRSSPSWRFLPTLSWFYAPLFSN